MTQPCNYSREYTSLEDILREFDLNEIISYDSTLNGPIEMADKFAEHLDKSTYKKLHAIPEVYEKITEIHAASQYCPYMTGKLNAFFTQRCNALIEAFREQLEILIDDVVEPVLDAHERMNRDYEAQKRQELKEYYDSIRGPGRDMR